ncbi:MAG TPA: hypothetical protein VLX92_00690 [Kofleriaceae bacterium]|nr:hypothetical protein [Kofleriaceae bacterium]
MTTKRPIGKALANPLNLGVGAAAATLAIGLGSLPLGALGALAYAALVAYDALGKPKAGGEPPELPDPKTLRDPGTREAVQKLRGARDELARALAETGADVIANLTTTLSSLHELEAHAGQLALRAEDLAGHLASADVAGLVAEVKQLTARIDGTPDPTAKQTFEQAKAARLDELRTLKELKVAKDRIDANLQRVVAVLCALPTKVVHMRALDAQAMDKISGDMNDELAAIGSELKTSEELVKHLGDGP